MKTKGIDTLYTTVNRLWAIDLGTQTLFLRPFASRHSTCWRDVSHDSTQQHQPSSPQTTHLFRTGLLLLLLLVKELQGFSSHELVIFFAQRVESFHHHIAQLDLRVPETVPVRDVKLFECVRGPNVQLKLRRDARAPVDGV